MNAESAPRRAVSHCARLFAGSFRKEACELAGVLSQVARVKCIAEWNAKKGSLDHARKLALLKELLVLLFHGELPSLLRFKHAHEYSRVFVCSQVMPTTGAPPTLEKPRVTCKHHALCCALVGGMFASSDGGRHSRRMPGAYRLDMTAQFKNSRFSVGATRAPHVDPFCSAFSFAVRPVRDEREMIAPYLDEYVQLVSLDLTTSRTSSAPPRGHSLPHVSVVVVRKGHLPEVERVACPPRCCAQGEML